VSLCVDEETPPFTFALIEGAAIVEADASDLLYWATHLAGRYWVSSKPQSVGRNAVPGELLVCVTLTKVVVKKNVSG
jgi:hypothetical protein